MIGRLLQGFSKRSLEDEAKFKLVNGELTGIDALLLSLPPIPVNMWRCREHRAESTSKEQGERRHEARGNHKRGGIKCGAISSKLFWGKVELLSSCTSLRIALPDWA